MKIKTWKGADRTETETTVREYPTLVIDEKELRDFNTPTVLQLDLEKDGKTARFWLSVYTTRGKAYARISTNRGRGSSSKVLTASFKELGNR